ncbi:hypothetical protein I79_011942 [Cricetulus griseus]|uniref:Uncharacterized protein n=1 Tax=Cricetulus griseus TaxID=10029 RepID=G3HMH9_CRIGR|nr:hypothetical protein I79_011942 [Cricetulus griseus]
MEFNIAIWQLESRWKKGTVPWKSFYFNCPYNGLIKNTEDHVPIASEHIAIFAYIRKSKM